tara:strand:- start:92 stop:358 length:267 start_codon:yes stop_codon:yes gene_type:complete
MNNYYTYPIENAPNFINQSYQVNTTKEENCYSTQEYKEECTPNVMNGYHKPLNELCPTITGQLNVDVKDNCNSLWNNMTRRKTVVKDY